MIPDTHKYLGKNYKEVVETLTKKYPELNIHGVATTSFVTADYRTDRYRVWYDPKTLLVTEIVNG